MKHVEAESPPVPTMIRARASEIAALCRCYEVRQLALLKRIIERTKVPFYSAALDTSRSPAAYGGVGAMGGGRRGKVVFNRSKLYATGGQ